MSLSRRQAFISLTVRIGRTGDEMMTAVAFEMVEVEITH
jgi:hypothetical protein